MYKILSTNNDEIVKLDELKQYLKITYSDEDAVLQNYLLASIQTAENFMNISLSVKMIEFNIEVVNKIRFALPILPFLTLEKVVLEDKQEITDRCQVINNNLYLNSFYQGSLRIIYKCGTTANTLAHAIKQGILSHAGGMYDKQVVDNEFLNSVFNFYRPFRKVLI